MDNKKVYVDLTALAEWGNQFNNLNNGALDILKSFEATLDDLDNYWKGNFATGFINDTTRFTSKARQVHNAMKDVPLMLKEIIGTKNEV